MKAWRLGGWELERWIEAVQGEALVGKSEEGPGIGDEEAADGLEGGRSWGRCGTPTGRAGQSRDRETADIGGGEVGELGGSAVALSIGGGATVRMRGARACERRGRRVTACRSRWRCRCPRR
jgi:hypothetical protein